MGEWNDLGAGTDALAASLGLPVERLIELFGAGWSAMPADRSEANAFEEGADTWWISGDPPQLILIPGYGDGAVLLSVPRGRWSGPGTLVYEPAGVVRVRLDDDPKVIAAVLEQLLRRRRRTFGYCRYCRRLTPPEHRQDSDVCMGCASRWLGIVY